MRRALIHVILGVLMSGSALPAMARVPAAAPGSEALASRAGCWTVTETVWDQPGASPVTSSGLVAERRMVGAFLEERLVPANDPTSGPKRIDYLGYDQVAGRWSYVSLETRVAVPLMPAWSQERGNPGHIVVDFAPFAMPGSSAAVLPGSDASPIGQMLRMQQAITQDGPDHETKDQWFTLADGSGRKWLAHRYDYRRQR